MTTGQFLKILRRELGKILVIVVIFAGVTFLIAKTQPPVYEAATTVSVNPKTLLKQAEVNFYLYDNYYAIQATGFIADTISAWVQSPGIVAQIYDRAGQPLPQGDTQKLSRIFATKKETEKVNVLTISTTGEDATQIKKLIETASQVVQDEIAKLNKAQTTTQFDTNFTPPVVITLPSKNLIYAAIAGIIGFLLALILAFQTSTRNLGKGK